jgi:hypothetical protein
VSTQKFQFISFATYWNNKIVETLKIFGCCYCCCIFISDRFGKWREIWLMCNDMDRKCSSSTSCSSCHSSRNSVGQLLALTWSQVNDNSHFEGKNIKKTSWDRMFTETIV